VLTDSTVESADTSGENARLKSKLRRFRKQRLTLFFRQLVYQQISKALGSRLQELPQKKGKIIVDDYYRTNVPGVFAIGDIVMVRHWPM